MASSQLIRELSRRSLGQTAFAGALQHLQRINLIRSWRIAIESELRERFPGTKALIGKRLKPGLAQTTDRRDQRPTSQSDKQTSASIAAASLLRIGRPSRRQTHFFLRCRKIAKKTEVQVLVSAGGERVLPEANAPDFVYQILHVEHAVKFCEIPDDVESRSTARQHFRLHHRE